MRVLLKKQPGPGESAQGLGMFRGISTVHLCKNGPRLKKAGDCEYSHENGTPAPGNMFEVFFLFLSFYSNSS